MFPAKKNQCETRCQKKEYDGSDIIEVSWNNIDHLESCVSNIEIYEDESIKSLIELGIDSSEIIRRWKNKFKNNLIEDKIQD